MKNSLKVIFRILTAVKTRNLPGECIFFHLVFIGWSEIRKIWFWMWKNTVHSHKFFKKCKKPLFLGVLAIFLKIRIFREKSGRVTFFRLWISNFMPKIRNILQAVFQNFESSYIFWTILIPIIDFPTCRAQNLENQIFRAKSGSVSLLRYLRGYFRQKIRKILQAVFHNLKANRTHNLRLRLNWRWE
jgi:hypothetical protein